MPIGRVFVKDAEDPFAEHRVLGGTAGVVVEGGAGDAKTPRQGCL